jgi:hypothetical protein
MGIGGMSLSNDEYSLIFSHNFSISSLNRKTNSTSPTTDWGLILNIACAVTATVFFALMFCLTPWRIAIFFLAGLCMILAIQTVTLLVFFAAVVKGGYTKKFYGSSVIFWGWWPVWISVMVVVAAILGLAVGMFLWSNYLGPFNQYKGLQKYKDVNPAVVPGVRIQDAGLVDFVDSTGLDRSKGGCFLDKGDTYCVAPIVEGGQVQYGLQGIPRTGSYDYFAVGKNCCSCPNRDFQCGQWHNPFARGGMRSLDYKGRPFYRLALDDWQATYQKSSKTPTFFEWVESPEYVWKGMWNYTLYTSILTIAFALSLALLIGLLLDRILLFCWARELILPRSCLAPAEGMEKITEVLLPRMYWRYQQEQSNIANMPVSAEWQPIGGGGGKESLQKKDYAATQEARQAFSMSSGLISSLMAPPGA